MLRYAIPEYRLPDKVLEKEIDAILNLGIDLRLSTRIGEDIPWAQLTDEYDMVCLTIGAQKSAPLGIPGEDLKGVQGAVEFLREARSMNVSCTGEKVAVIGGGDSAIDAARTALRLGAAQVEILYRRLKEDMPAQADEIEAALEEGIGIRFLVAPVEIKGKNGKVTTLLCGNLELGPYDKSGRRRPVSSGKDPFKLDVDRVLAAVGQSAEMPFRGSAHGIQITSGGWISVTEGSESGTANPNVFAGGDVKSGPATVARAIAAGFRIAEDIDRTVRNRNGEPEWMAPEDPPLDISMSVPEDVGDVPQETRSEIA